MIADARTIPDGSILDTDVCVVGAGAAGVTLARALAEAPLRVVVLESGGSDPDDAGQRLCRGESTGLPGVPLHHARLRCLGGSTRHWTGWCRPLDRADFEARAWVPHSGWPFGPEELEPYYGPARAACGLGPFPFDAAAWDGSPVTVEGSGLRTAIFQFSPPTDFGLAHRAALEASHRLTVWLHASALRLVTDDAGGRVHEARVAAANGRRFGVRARAFALAAGGIENARLLLLSNDPRPAGLGNGHDLVGRFYMEHPYAFTDALLPDAPPPAIHVFPPTCRRSAEGASTGAVGAMALAERVARDEGLVGCAAYLAARPRYKTRRAFHSVGTTAALTLVDRLRRGEVPRDAPRRVGRALSGPRSLAAVAAGVAAHAARPRSGHSVRAFVEPVPDPASRVTLGDARDALGQRRARVDWRVGDLERASLRRLRALLDAALGRAGLGRLEGYPEDPDHGWPATLTGASHHMGTTRMHASPRRGVVDADGRVHGVANLYVAGSSVFPTSGIANPTLTIVALALRLGDALRARLA